MTERADVVVVGMGPGGEDLAGRLAEAGLERRSLPLKGKSEPTDVLVLRV